MHICAWDLFTPVPLSLFLSPSRCPRTNYQFSRVGRSMSSMPPWRYFCRCLARFSEGEVWTVELVIGCICPYEEGRGHCGKFCQANDLRPFSLSLSPPSSSRSTGNDRQTDALPAAPRCLNEFPPLAKNGRGRPNDRRFERRGGTVSKVAVLGPLAPACARLSIPSRKRRHRRRRRRLFRDPRPTLCTCFHIISYSLF